MQDNLDLLGEVTLNDLCIPGSHDAGMNVYMSGTAFTSSCNTLTQSNNIQGQLNLGIRYFHIRPVISGGHFLTGHYKKIIAWQGANGESIVDGINAFTAINNELIIIRISHTLNTDVGVFSYRYFSGDEWKRLFYELDKINNLYKYEEKDNIRNLTLNTLTNKITRSAVLFIIQNSDISLGERYKQGFLYLNDFNMYDSYSNTEDLFNMGSDQFKKMHDYAPSYYFLLSWTLTQSSVQAVTCATTISDSIKELANQANDALVDYVYPRITKMEYPNIVHIDNVLDVIAATLALAINWTVLSYKK
ncbi:hypothetical protein [Xenorhabdus bovienii]|uniref:hypothetical protein n=1 Tax=Xenorhabdus bovienii TaxID=40576 RepID=UPI00237D141B|nr:hypothetical protein [Xenorhabdus bovienii]MDE1475591.1 hypothetical protein [Xenorhabdus bovienii]